MYMSITLTVVSLGFSLSTIANGMSLMAELTAAPIVGEGLWEIESRMLGLSAEDPTVKDKVWDFGRELCAGRPDHPLCKRFGGSPATTNPPTTTHHHHHEEHGYSVGQRVRARGDHDKMGTVTSIDPLKILWDKTIVDADASSDEVEAIPEASTTTPAPVEETTQMTQTTQTPTTTVAKAKENVEEEQKSIEKEGTTSKNGKAPEQGYWGPMVRHTDGETLAGDWQEEYPVSHHDSHDNHDSHDSQDIQSGLEKLGKATTDNMEKLDNKVQITDDGLKIKSASSSRTPGVVLLGTLCNALMVVYLAARL